MTTPICLTLLVLTVYLQWRTIRRRNREIDELVGDREDLRMRLRAETAPARNIPLDGQDPYKTIYQGAKP